MSKKKHNIESENNSIEKEGIVISDKTDIVPAKEEKPDQSILNKPAPKKGITLKESWGHNKHLKNK
jgi:hypothetical protein